MAHVLAKHKKLHSDNPRLSFVFGQLRNVGSSCSVTEPAQGHSSRHRNSLTQSEVAILVNLYEGVQRNRGVGIDQNVLYEDGGRRLLYFLGEIAVGEGSRRRREMFVCEERGHPKRS